MSKRRHAMVGPIALWKMKRRFQIKFLRTAGLLPQHYLADIGCGTLRGGIPLIRYLEPGHYYGVESRTDALAEGRKELSDSGLLDRAPHLIHAEHIRDCDLGRRVEFIWAFSVLIHMTDDILLNALAFAYRHLARGGVFYANVNVGDMQHLGSWQGFPVMSRSLDFYRQACANAGLSLHCIGSLRDVGHVSGKESQDTQQMLKIAMA